MLKNTDYASRRSRLNSHHPHDNFSSRVSDTLLASVVPGTDLVHRHTCKQNSYMH